MPLILTACQNKSQHSSEEENRIQHLHNVSSTISKITTQAEAEKFDSQSRKKVNRKRSTNEPNIKLADKNFKITMINMLKKKNILFLQEKEMDITSDMTGNYEI